MRTLLSMAIMMTISVFVAYLIAKESANQVTTIFKYVNDKIERATK